LSTFSPHGPQVTRHVRAALADCAEVVATNLPGKPSNRSRRECCWARKGSLWLRLLGAKRGRRYDHERDEGGDLINLIAREGGVNLSRAIRLAADYLASSAPRSTLAKPHQQSADDDDAEARTPAALRLWDEGKPLVGTLGEVYFVEHRGLNIHALDLDDALRWNTNIKAVVALMTDALTGEPTGVHCTFLDTGGAKLGRKILGHRGVVRLSPDREVTMGLGITEGVEDGMSVLLSRWAPLWAVTSAGAIARFPLLAGLECLTIFTDGDMPGMRVAEACAARWRDAGAEVCISARWRSAT